MSDRYNFNHFQSAQRLERHDAESYHVIMDDETEIYLPHEESPVTPEEFFGKKDGNRHFPQKVSVIFDSSFERDIKEDIDYEEMFMLIPQHTAEEVHFKPMGTADIKDYFKPYEGEQIYINSLGAAPERGTNSGSLYEEILILQDEGEIAIPSDELDYSGLRNVTPFAEHQQLYDLDYDFTEEKLFIISRGTSDVIVKTDRENVIDWVMDNYGTNSSGVSSFF